MMSVRSIPAERRLFALCVALMVGEAVGFACGPCGPVAVAGVLLALLTAAFGYGCGWRGWPVACVLLAGCALAVFSACSRAETLDRIDADPSGAFETTVTVDGPVSVRSGKGDRRWVSFSSRIGDVRVRVVLPEGPSGVPRRGETWACGGWLKLRGPDDPSRERTFWVNGRGTFAYRVKEASRADRALEWLRREFSRRIGLGLDHDPQAANLNRAILLGERSRIGRTTKNAFVEAGTVHVFAISGLHVMILVGVFSFLSALAGVPVRWAGLVVVPLVWTYVVVTGSSPSSVRAAAMATLYLLAPMAWRQANGLVAWSLTFLAVYGLAPERFHDVGCLLSFAVMLSLILAGRMVGEDVVDWRRSVVLSLATWTAAVPIAAHVFARVTPGGLLSNLLLIPAAGFSVSFCVLGVLTSFVSDTIAAHLNNLSALLTDLMVGCSYAVASLPGASFEVQPWSLWQCAAWYVVILLLWWLFRSVRSRRIF